MGYVQPALAPTSMAVVKRAMWSMRRGLKGSEPTSEGLLHWLRNRLSTDKVSAATVMIERTYANKFLEWCVTMGYLERNPMDPVPTLTVPVRERPTISDEQFATLKQASHNEVLPWGGFMTVAWYTGARTVDICNLQWDAIDLEQGTWTFVPRKTRRSGLEVKLPLSGELLATLKLRAECKEHPVWVFPVFKVFHDRSDGTIPQEWRKFRNKTDLPKNITLHCFRHTRATRMLNAPDGQQVDPISAANILGITSLATLRRYNHTPLSVKKRAMDL